jgi:hypothetical protein
MGQEGARNLIALVRRIIFAGITLVLARGMLSFVRVAAGNVLLDWLGFRSKGAWARIRG